MTAAILIIVAELAGAISLGLHEERCNRRRTFDEHWETLPEWARRQP